MAAYLKKPFKDSLSGIKERMKERRNQKWIRLGKTSQTSTVRCKIPANHSKQIKSLQANNKALAQALQEEKVQRRDAEATVLYLTKTCQDLRLQIFDLERKLRCKQEGLVENRLSALNEIISQVSQNLLDSIDLLGPVKDLCSIAVNQRPIPAALKSSSSVVEQIHSVKLNFLPAKGKDIQLPQSRVGADDDRNELAHTVVDICEESDKDLSLLTVVPDKGQTSDFHLDSMGSELESVSLSGSDGFGHVLPKCVSTRRRYSKMRNHELGIGVLDYSEAPDSIEELSQQDEIRLEESLQKCTVENINSDISQLNKVGLQVVEGQIDSETAQFKLSSDSDLKRECKSKEDFQIRKEKHRKRKLQRPKNTSKQRPKQKQDKEVSTEKLDFLGGFSDAYNFNFEERVHLTPFRQNKVNDTNTSVDDKDSLSETSTMKSSDVEEDSDDSLYEPYKSKSKKKSSADKKDPSPVCARPRSKRCLSQHEEKLHNDTETESSKSSDKSVRQPSEPSHRLCDVTNTISLLPSGGHANTAPGGEGPRSPKRKRSCTLTVSYKEPSIAGKLRRGDPFTDTHFLNSPIFKQKKTAKCHSVKKEALSKYNEKFVGCC
ncbi:PREDICTED: shugoshin-like 1 [Merops nubicus]|uniref:shugoshin-like 1 n=1 Tax=Merops nubicus TaxID=57421 RepID=UPI0004F039D6|nr:PREDICTED: shugoshin-like 1 [Merops nubicus]